MTKRLQDKVAVITGTAGGMGREAALRFAAEGAAVVGCDLKEEENLETVALVEAQGGRMLGLQPLDLFDEDAVRGLMERAAEEFGGIDILYNNAGSFRTGEIESHSREDFEFSLTAEITTVFLAIKHAIPHFRRRGRGAIVNIGSVAGMLGTSFPGNLPGAIGHCITKAAVIRMSEVAAIELAPLNIRVNAICPGPILTPQLAQFVGEHGENEVGQGYLAAGLADRLGRNSDVVEAAVYLASDAAEFITGVNLPVDGGFTVSGGRGRPDAAMAESFRKILAPEGS